MPVIQTPKDRALEQAESGRNLAAAIHDAILTELPTDTDELAIYAGRVSFCNETSNIWTARDLHTADGDAYDGSGHFWQCGHKLCPHCVSKASRRNRTQLSAMISQDKLRVGENYEFITLTMPNQGIGLLETRKLVNDAWAVFRKRRWFKQTIIGGAKSEEFTLTAVGYHYHLHILVRSKYIFFSTLRHLWLEALQHAFAKSGRELIINTKDKEPMVKVKRVAKVSEAIKEVAKYITKTSTWSRIPAADLLDVCRIRRFPRMFEMFGSYRLIRSRVAGAELIINATANRMPKTATLFLAFEIINRLVNKTILDTGCISDALEDDSWRAMATVLGAAEYLDFLHSQIIDATHLRMDQLRRKYDVATFWRLRPMPVSTVSIISTRLKRIADAIERRDRKPIWWRFANGPGVDIIERTA